MGYMNDEITFSQLHWDIYNTIRVVPSRKFSIQVCDSPGKKVINQWICKTAALVNIMKNINSLRNHFVPGFKSEGNLK